MWQLVLFPPYFGTRIGKYNFFPQTWRSVVSTDIATACLYTNAYFVLLFWIKFIIIKTEWETFTWYSFFLYLGMCFLKHIPLTSSCVTFRITFAIYIALMKHNPPSLFIVNVFCESKLLLLSIKIGHLYNVTYGKGREAYWLYTTLSSGPLVNTLFKYIADKQVSKQLY